MDRVNNGHLLSAPACVLTRALSLSLPCDVLCCGQPEWKIKIFGRRGTFIGAGLNTKKPSASCCPPLGGVQRDSKVSVNTTMFGFGDQDEEGGMPPPLDPAWANVLRSAFRTKPDVSSFGQYLEGLSVSDFEDMTKVEVVTVLEMAGVPTLAERLHLAKAIKMSRA
jgi:hypothetical protein